jgi:phage tail-like protein
MISVNVNSHDLIEQGRRLLKHLPSIYSGAVRDPLADRDSFDPRDDPRSPLLALLALWQKLYSELEDLREFAGEIVDPEKAHDVPPQDFLSWLAHWVALDPDDEIFYPFHGEQDRPRLRKAVERAAKLYMHRGTAKGLHDMAEVFLDEEISIHEWAWPSALSIGLSSTIGVDAFLTGHEDVDCCFVVTMRPQVKRFTNSTGLHWLQLPLAGRDNENFFSLFVSEPPIPENATLLGRLRRLRRLLDREKPAHTDCFIVLDFGPVEDAFPANPLIIGVNSIIGSFWIEDASFR